MRETIGAWPRARGAVPDMRGGAEKAQETDQAGEPAESLVKRQKKLQDTLNQGLSAPFLRPSRRTCGRSGVKG